MAAIRRCRKARCTSVYSSATRSHCRRHCLRCPRYLRFAVATFFTFITAVPLSSPFPRSCSLLDSPFASCAAGSHFCLLPPARLPASGAAAPFCTFLGRPDRRRRRASTFRGHAALLSKLVHVWLAVLNVLKRCCVCGVCECVNRVRLASCGTKYFLCTVSSSFRSNHYLFILKLF